MHAPTRCMLRSGCSCWHWAAGTAWAETSSAALAWGSTPEPGTCCPRAGRGPCNMEGGGARFKRAGQLVATRPARQRARWDNTQFHSVRALLATMATSQPAARWYGRGARGQHLPLRRSATTLSSLASRQHQCGPAGRIHRLTRTNSKQLRTKPKQRPHRSATMLSWLPSSRYICTSCKESSTCTCGEAVTAGPF